MPLLAECAITPDVFDMNSYSTPDECAARIENIRETILTGGLVRDLCDGSWSALFNTGQRQVRRHAAAEAPTPWTDSGKRTWHRRGTELVKKLTMQKRLVPYRPANPGPPADDVGWCTEALATHATQPLTGGVIVTKPLKDQYASERVVARIDRLSSAQWWRDMQSASIRLTRTCADYEWHLDPVLRCSNSLMFIDPYVDPTEPGYQCLGTLLQRVGRRTPAPLIEIHRRVPTDRDMEEFKCQFRDALFEPLRAAGLNARVFMWTRFHDRYLISNLVGISLPYGFDTGRGRTTWTRLGMDDRDDIQREFDPNSLQRKLVSDFTIP
ncbi:MAG: hypothetical protein OXG04_03300 [Acidobacteria bacterium]|nr:hypothetical protein [Acidobacteriota bacterium]